jgi:mRNA interferase HigB
VRIISKARVRLFWESRKHDSQADEWDCSTWLKLTANAAWPNSASLKQTFGSADQVGNCVVFDVGNDRYRLIGRVFYQKDRRRGIVYVLRVMDHAEYDKQLWIDDCGCYKPPPKKSAKATPAGARRRRKRKRTDDR